jgi:hypothetical protein
MEKRNELRWLKYPHYRMIRVAYRGPTDNSGSCFNLFCHRTGQKKRLSFDYELSDGREQAIRYLEGLGFNIVGFTSTRAVYFILVSDFDKSINPEVAD